MKKVNLGSYLVHEGLISPDQLRTALEQKATAGGRLGTNLLELRAVREDQLLEALGKLCSTKTASKWDLKDVDPSVIEMVPERLARRYKLVPYALDGKTLLIASKDAGNLLVEDEIRMLTGCMVRTSMALELRILAALAQYYDALLASRTQRLLRRLDGVPRTSSSTLPPPPELGPQLSPELKRPRPPADTKPSSDVPDAGSSAPPSSPRPLPVASAPPPAEAREVATGRVATGQAAMEQATRGDADARAVGVAAVEPTSPRAAGVVEEISVRVEQPLARATRRLQAAEIRDDIADAVMDFTATVFKRRMLLYVRRKRIIGWRGEGAGLVGDRVRTIDIDAHHASVFATVEHTEGYWLGPLPKHKANLHLVLALGGDRPPESFVLPITLRSRAIAFLYGDNIDQPVRHAPVEELRSLGAKAGLAFEICVLKNKLRLS